MGLGDMEPNNKITKNTGGVSIYKLAYSLNLPPPIPPPLPSHTHTKAKYGNMLLQLAFL